MGIRRIRFLPYVGTCLHYCVTRMTIKMPVVREVIRALVDPFRWSGRPPKPYFIDAVHNKKLLQNHSTSVHETKH